jgi:hypothetical protein
VILFSLIGVGEREFAHRLVEIVLFADIAGDCQGSPAFACARARTQPQTLA